MNIFQKQQTTSGYNTIPDDNDDETADVPLGTTLLSPPTTMTMPTTTTMTTTKEHRLSKWMVAIVAGMITILVAYGDLSLVK